jgi:hypothetical protein
MTDYEKAELYDRMAAFLSDLNSLTRKHHIELCGCGCCGSPWLEDCKSWETGYYTSGRGYDEVTWVDK